MALESATYISDLNISNPAAGDPVGQADDHLRLIKSVLKNTFPNVDGACSATDTDLSSGVVPIGLIAMWSGAPGSLPTNWKLCDGGTYAKSDGSGNLTVPDLREKFIKGCGGTTGAPTTAPTISTTGGATSNTPTITVGGTAITQANLPVCSFTVTDPGHVHAITDPGHAHVYTAPVATTILTYTVPVTAYVAAGAAWTSAAYTGVTVNSNTTGVTVASGGSGTTHTHTGSSTAVPTEPPYYVLAFIIKV